MQYRKFGKTGEKVSVLGFGCMRFPTIMEDGKEKIDEDQAIAMLRTAIDEGVNYIDTAYMYHNYQSEDLVGKALSGGYREKVYVATKSPVFELQKPEDFESVLQRQLQKLQTEYIDFYLLHALSANTWENIVLKFDLLSKMKRAKEEGKIRHIGFSFHDNLETFYKIVDSFDQWEFCQIQLNYVDTHYQAGLEGLRYAAKKGLGIVIMEPLLGGRLAVPPQRVHQILGEEKGPVQWALEYLWDLPEVSIILSGMSTPQQLEENLFLADNAATGMLTEQQKTILFQARETFLHTALVNCTGCSYCMPCPAGLDIPGIFKAYNQTAATGLEEGAAQYYSLSKLASSCIQCGACQKLCPQHIPSASLMPEIHALMQSSERAKSI